MVCADICSRTHFSLTLCAAHATQECNPGKEHTGAVISTSYRMQTKAVPIRLQTPSGCKHRGPVGYAHATEISWLTRHFVLNRGLSTLSSQVFNTEMEMRMHNQDRDRESQAQEHGKQFDSRLACVKPCILGQVATEGRSTVDPSLRPSRMTRQSRHRVCHGCASHRYWPCRVTEHQPRPFQSRVNRKLSRLQLQHHRRQQRPRSHAQCTMSRDDAFLPLGENATLTWPAIPQRMDSRGMQTRSDTATAVVNKTRRRRRLVTAQQATRLAAKEAEKKRRFEDSQKSLF